jgi:hypothetical protein
MRIYGNKLRTIFGPKRAKITGQRKLYNESLLSNGYRELFP